MTTTTTSRRVEPRRLAEPRSAEEDRLVEQDNRRRLWAIQLEAETATLASLLYVAKQNGTSVYRLSRLTGISRKNIDAMIERHSTTGTYRFITGPGE